MTSVGTETATTVSAADWVGRRGMGQFGTKNPKWYPCVVKMDNKDGTIKVQWEEDQKFTKRLPVEKFKLENDDDVEYAENVPVNIFALASGDGDY